MSPELLLNDLPRLSLWLKQRFINGLSDEKYFYGMLEKGVEYWGEYTIESQKKKRNLKLACESCHRLTPIPYFTPQALADSYISVVRTRGGRVIYFCSSDCRKRHRSVLANRGIEFRPEHWWDVLEAENNISGKKS